MIMAPAEIAAEYRQAKKPLLQIGILADLNGCTRKEIAAVLREQGCELPERYKTAQEKAKADTSSGAVAPPSPQGEGNASQGRCDAGASQETGPECARPRPLSIIEQLEMDRGMISKCENYALRIMYDVTGEQQKPLESYFRDNVGDVASEISRIADHVLLILRFVLDELGGADDD